ncbi:sialate O-acetylesterase [Verrucomicrobiota bacterium]
MRYYFILFFCITLNILTCEHLFGVELPEIFADHAVFQRDQAVPVWGTGKPGEKIKVSFAGQEHSAQADTNGLWRVELSPMKASAEGRELVVVGNNTLRRADILVGEVWLCSGQSNMTAGGRTRCWSRTGSVIPQSARKDSLARVYRGPGRNKPVGWSIITSGGNIPGCLAVSLCKELEVPVGTADISIGGSSIQGWLRKELVSEEVAADKRARGAPSVMDTKYLRPVEGYGIRGFVWLQGEANIQQYDLYTDLKQLLVNDWRKRWGKPLPFHFGQIATYCRPLETQARQPGKRTHLSRPGLYFLDAQWRYCLRDSNSTMAVTVDLGDACHYASKTDTAARMAMGILAREYGRKDIVWQAPTLRSAERSGENITIELDHAEGLHAASVEMISAEEAESVTLGKDGVIIKRAESRKDDKTLVIRKASGQSPLGFAVETADGSWYEVAAVINGSSVTLTIPSGVEPIAVAGGVVFADGPDGKSKSYLPNCYNKDSLPLVSFYEKL